MGRLRAHAPLAIAAAAIVFAGCTDDQVARPMIGSTSSTTGSTGSSIGSTTGSNTGTTDRVPTSSDPGGGSGSRVRGLQRFADCSAFLDYVQAAARDRVGPYGLDGMGGYYGPPMMMEGDVVDFATRAGAAEMAPVATMAASDIGSQSAATVPGPNIAGPNSTGPNSTRPNSTGPNSTGTDFTGTNVQEAGVDEPDIIKTDGDRIIVISDQTLSYIDVSGGTPVVVDRLTIEGGWGHELFFAGDRALLFTNNNTWPTPLPATAPSDQWTASALITEVDLSDPADLKVTATVRIEGQYLSARAIGDHVRLALSSGPQSLGWVYPSSPAGEDNATEANRSIIDRTTLSDWTPSYTVHSGSTTTTGDLLECSQMHQPAEFAGFEMISIIDMNLADGLASSLSAPANSGDAPSSVGVLADGQTVYSSLDRMYVATTKWVPINEPQQWDESLNETYETSIHSFAIEAGEPTRYVASGTVPGSLLNQFALDEHNGYLRAITTEGAPWSAAEQSDSSLRVLAEDGDQLVTVGAVGGLGRGERLYSARLMGDIGFAVTFRQTDPFYVLDLSDPFKPMVTGELKIPGYSSYLHPVGDIADSGLVLGVGQDATDIGQVRGLKLSLFDVSDPTNPVERDVWTLGGGSSGAEYDHRAFQMIGSTAIVPTQSWTDGFAGATVFEVTADGIDERGRVAHESAAFTTDCTVIDPSQLDDGDQLFWQAGASIVSVCTPNQTGNATGENGFTGWCETIVASDVQYWINDLTRLDATLDELGLGNEDRIELCYPDTYASAILRSLVIADQLYTMSPATLQANDLASLAANSSVSLR
jgi:uncharacterized secreted protein with C-terminal beta-propeller domain